MTGDVIDQHKSRNLLPGPIEMRNQVDLDLALCAVRQHLLALILHRLTALHRRHLRLDEHPGCFADDFAHGPAKRRFGSPAVEFCIGAVGEYAAQGNNIVVGDQRGDAVRQRGQELLAVNLAPVRRLGLVVIVLMAHRPHPI